MVALLKKQDAAFRSGGKQAYRKSWSNLRIGIMDAKHKYKQHIEEQFKNNNPHIM